MIRCSKFKIIIHSPCYSTMGSKPAPPRLARPRGCGTDHDEIVRTTAPPCTPSQPAASAQLRAKAPRLASMIQNEKFRLAGDKARGSQPCELEDRNRRR